MPTASRGADEEAIACLRRRPDSTAILVDFDGTLAPIVADPTTSRPLPGALELLDALTAVYAVVGVVSGRPARFLFDVLSLAERPRLIVFGLYGLESVRAGRIERAPGAEHWEKVIETLAGELEPLLPNEAGLERKGLGLTLHYRGAKDPELVGRAVESLVEQASLRTGLEIRPGRRVVELVPPGAPTKGSVVAELVEGLDAACYLGDDVADLSAFEALSGLSCKAAVAVASSEAPRALLERADVVVDGPNGALALLAGLLDT